MIRYPYVFPSVLVGLWVLMAPPTPLGTSLPPVSEWLPEAKYKTSEECERSREALRRLAQLTITNDPNAPALKVAAALGQLQARCFEHKPPEPAAKPPAPAAPKVVEPPAAGSGAARERTD